MTNRYDVAAYIWPSYHYEPRMEKYWPEKDGEWYTVRRATPRFPGHDMPRIPLLGCQDEADPGVNREHIALAAAHGINTFIMDWYWYDDAPCFERQLNEGLIPALAGADTKFFLMWANHDASSLWDMHTDAQELLWLGTVDRATLEPMFDRIIEKYLALDWMRRRCVEKGLPGLHLQAIARGGRGVEAGADLTSGTQAHTVEELGFDSSTAYQFCHDSGGDGDYVRWADKAIACWEPYEAVTGCHFPHVSIGWDNTQRNPSKDTAVSNATPDAFEACLWKAKRYIDARPDRAPLVTINSWNEWTEGSYLLPDMRWGYRYLQAVRNVFGASAVTLK